MRIDINQDLNHPLELKASKLLRSYKDSPFYNDNYGLRHPFAIYNVSINSVIENQKNLLSNLERIQSDQLNRELSDKKINNDLIVATDQYLDSIMEHLDDCLSIIKAMFPIEEEKHYKKTCRQFNQAIKNFRDHIAKQVNNIKHNQARIRLVTFYTDVLFIPGYFIEGVLPDGAIGPHPEIHYNSNTAFSYNREVRYLICGLFFVSEILANTIKQKFRGSVGSAQKNEDNRLDDIVDRISQLLFMFFPDEYKKPVPLILRTPKQRIIRYPSQFSRPQKLPSPIHIKTEFQGDGVSKSFKLPYFGKDA